MSPDYGITFGVEGDWAGTSADASNATKESALTHFKEDLVAAALQWVDNKAKSKKYRAIGIELTEFEAVLADRPLGTA